MKNNRFFAALLLISSASIVFRCESSSMVSYIHDYYPKQSGIPVDSTPPPGSSAGQEGGAENFIAMKDLLRPSCCCITVSKSEEGEIVYMPYNRSLKADKLRLEILNTDNTTNPMIVFLNRWSEKDRNGFLRQNFLQGYKIYQDFDLSPVNQVFLKGVIRREKNTDNSDKASSSYDITVNTTIAPVDKVPSPKTFGNDKVNCLNESDQKQISPDISPEDAPKQVIEIIVVASDEVYSKEAAILFRKNQERILFWSVEGDLDDTMNSIDWSDRRDIECLKFKINCTIKVDTASFSKEELSSLIEQIDSLRNPRELDSFTASPRFLRLFNNVATHHYGKISFMCVGAIAATYYFLNNPGVFHSFLAKLSSQLGSVSARFVKVPVQG